MKSNLILSFHLCFIADFIYHIFFSLIFIQQFRFVFLYSLNHLRIFYFSFPSQESHRKKKNKEDAEEAPEKVEFFFCFVPAAICFDAIKTEFHFRVSCRCSFGFFVVFYLSLGLCVLSSLQCEIFPLNFTVKSRNFDGIISWDYFIFEMSSSNGK